MKAALREGRIPVLYFAEQDFLNGYFKVQLRLGLGLGLPGAAPKALGWLWMGWG